MHHALKVPEILLNIFSHWRAPYSRHSSSYASREPLRPVDLVALARTCRTFKEPALDVLWSELADLTPVISCLPQVIYEIIKAHSGFAHRCQSLIYNLRRSLEQAEWDTLRGYTHRIRIIHDCRFKFASAFEHEISDELEVEIFLLGAPNDLFPNLRHMHYTCFLHDSFSNSSYHQPLPFLTSLTYVLGAYPEPLFLERHLKSLAGTSAKSLKQLILAMDDSADTMIDSVICDFICRWSNPRDVSCPLVILNIDAFNRLARASDLTRLSFILDSKLADCITHLDTTLCFRKLQNLELSTPSLISVSNLLDNSHIQFPALTGLLVKFKDIPTKQNVAFFLEILQKHGSCNFLRTLALFQWDGSNFHRDNTLVGDDLRPLRALQNLRRLDLNLNWKVRLADDDILELGAAWPHLEHLSINQKSGWLQAPAGGITPDGIIRLLQTCPSLHDLALVIDARGIVDTSFELDLSRKLSINVIDSLLGEVDVPAMVDFFAHLAHLMPSGILYYIRTWERYNWRVDKNRTPRRWEKAYKQAKQIDRRRRR